MQLEPLPPGFAETVERLHRLAETVISPAREQATGRIGLRATPGGFGTPPFGEDEQLRVEGAELVRRKGDHETREPIDGVDEASSRALAAWYAFGADLLEQLRAEATDDDTPSIVQLWPEHFDIAIDMGDEESGTRANYGFAVADADHPEPYVYVGPWTGGLETLSYSELLNASDRRTAALGFLRKRRDALRG